MNIDINTLNGSWSNSIISPLQNKLLNNFLSLINSFIDLMRFKPYSLIFILHNSVTSHKNFFRQLMNLELSCRRILGFENKASCEEIKKSKNFNLVNILLNKYFKIMLHALIHTTINAVKCFILKCLCVNYNLLALSMKLTRKLLNVTLKIFSNTTGKLCLNVIIFVRKLAVIFPGQVTEFCVKGTVCAYFVQLRHKLKINCSQPNFVLNSVIDIMSLDVEACYNVILKHIYHMASIIRFKMTNKEEKSNFVTNVYNNHIIRGFEIWTNALYSLCKWPELQPFSYPIVQLIIGTMKHRSNKINFIVRFQFLGLINILSKINGIFIPVSVLLIESLQFISSQSILATKLLYDFSINQTVLLNYLKNSSKQEKILLLIFERISDHLAQFANHLTILRSVILY